MNVQVVIVYVLKSTSELLSTYRKACFCERKRRKRGQAYWIMHVLCPSKNIWNSH